MPISAVWHLPVHTGIFAGAPVVTFKRLVPVEKDVGEVGHDLFLAAVAPRGGGGRGAAGVADRVDGQDGEGAHEDPDGPDVGLHLFAPVLSVLSVLSALSVLSVLIDTRFETWAGSSSWLVCWSLLVAFQKGSFYYDFRFSLLCLMIFIFLPNESFKGIRHTERRWFGH